MFSSSKVLSGPLLTKNCSSKNIEGGEASSHSSRCSSCMPDISTNSMLNKRLGSLVLSKHFKASIVTPVRLQHPMAWQEWCAWPNSEMFPARYRWRQARCFVPFREFPFCFQLRCDNVTDTACKPTPQSIIYCNVPPPKWTMWAHGTHHSSPGQRLHGTSLLGA